MSRTYKCEVMNDSFEGNFIGKELTAHYRLGLSVSEICSSSFLARTPSLVTDC